MPISEKVKITIGDNIPVQIDPYRIINGEMSFGRLPVKVEHPAIGTKHYEIRSTKKGIIICFPESTSKKKFGAEDNKATFDRLIFDSPQSRSYLQAMGYSEEQMEITFRRTAQRIKNGEAVMIPEEKFYED